MNNLGGDNKENKNGSVQGVNANDNVDVKTNSNNNSDVKSNNIDSNKELTMDSFWKDYRSGEFKDKVAYEAKDLGTITTRRRDNVISIKNGKIFKGEFGLISTRERINRNPIADKKIHEVQTLLIEKNGTVIDSSVVHAGKIDENHPAYIYNKFENDQLAKVEEICIPIKVVGVGNRVTMKRVHRRDVKCNPVDLVTRVNTKSFMNMIDGVDTTGVLTSKGKSEIRKEKSEVKSTPDLKSVPKSNVKVDVNRPWLGTYRFGSCKKMIDVSSLPVGVGVNSSNGGSKSFDGTYKGVKIEGYETSVTSKRRFKVRKEHRDTLYLGFIDYVKFDVGKSHTIGYRIPSYVDATVDSTSTTLYLRIRVGVNPFYDFDSDLARVALGNLAFKLCKLRKRSPYTGNGIVWANKTYPPLKSTKVAKK